MWREPQPSLAMAFPPDNRRDGLVALSTQRDQIGQIFMVQARIGPVMDLHARMREPDLAAVAVPLHGRAPQRLPGRRPANIPQIARVHQHHALPGLALPSRA